MSNALSPQNVSRLPKRLTSLLSTGRFGGHALLLAVAVGVIWLGRGDILNLVPASVDVGGLAAIRNVASAADPAPPTVAASNGVAVSDDITRLTELHTYIPDRPRLEIITYIVEASDTILGIGEKFGLKPETIVFGNPILNDNPHFLEPGQTLRIAPMDGIIRDVVAGDTIGGLAKAYGVTPEDIVNWPANNLNPDAPQITAGQVLFVPGGARRLIQFPTNTVNQPAAGGGSSGGGSNLPPPPKGPLVLRSGAGQCAGGYSGVVGSGGFVWPADNHYLSGYDFNGIHPGIDISADFGATVYAADSGIVVFAGRSEWGYGNTIIIDHGNNWHTLYGHLSQWFVNCGQGVYQGNAIGASGNTGRSAGAHLHFEVYYGNAQTNPWNYLPPP
ncbi:MAG: peptidoglycan DD-metalloendopeptidase family protein [Chloroflexi bacterium]|nr:peptidoglycan DD-metalloendopeptidase family protein [Chloroflexota bacterium]